MWNTQLPKATKRDGDDEMAWWYRTYPFLVEGGYADKYTVLAGTVLRSVLFYNVIVKVGR